MRLKSKLGIFAQKTENRRNRIENQHFEKPGKSFINYGKIGR
jgi:hypothetical protein